MTQIQRKEIAYTYTLVKLLQITRNYTFIIILITERRKEDFIIVIAAVTT